MTENPQSSSTVLSEALIGICAASSSWLWAHCRAGLSSAWHKEFCKLSLVRWSHFLLPARLPSAPCNRCLHSARDVCKEQVVKRQINLISFRWKHKSGMSLLVFALTTASIRQWFLALPPCCCHPSQTPSRGPDEVVRPCSRSHSCLGAANCSTALCSLCVDPVKSWKTLWVMTFP